MNANSDRNAFPVSEEDWKAEQYHGLTKREYFAAMAMQGILANKGHNFVLKTAKEAVEQADALLFVLEKEEE